MSERLLLLPGSRARKTIDSLYEGPYPRLRIFLMAVGLLMVLVGAANVMSRIASSLGPNAASEIFAPSVAQGSVASSTASAPFIPSRLKIASIGVDAAVESVGEKNGTMDTPKNFNDVAWYNLGSKPGEKGNAVFAGHVNNALTQAGVFEHLSQVSVGDYITVSDASGKTLLYRVVSMDQYPADEAPLNTIFSTMGPSQLVLYTCDGEWVPSERSYSRRLVVVAKAL